MEGRDYYTKLYPMLTNFKLYDNSETYFYNCISYSIGRKDVFTWPGRSVNDDVISYWVGNDVVTFESFDYFYNQHGYELCGNIDIRYDPNYTKVALFIKNGIPTHASIQIDENWWESKIGVLGIIKHDLFEIEGGNYGQVEYIYKKKKENLSESILNFDEFLKQIFEKKYEKI